jgi:chitodextrinase
VTGYKLVRDGTVLPGTVTGLSTTDTGLGESSTYTYTVRAVDAAGNVGADSNPVTVTTPAAADSVAPTAPTGLSSANLTSSSVDLSWNAASDDRAVTGYKLVRDGTVLPGTVTGLSTTDTGLGESSTYTYTVRAVDAAGNVGADSNPVTVTTPAVVGALFADTWSNPAGTPWSSAWATSASNGTVDTSANGGGHLGIVDTAGSYARAQLTGVAPRSDTDVTFTYQWAQSTAGAWFTVALRGSGGWQNGYRPKNGYDLSISPSAGTITLEKTVAGTLTTLQSVAKAQQVGTGKQHVRFRVSGSTVQFRTWIDGTPEPTTWNATVTDTSVTAGGQLFWSLNRGASNVGARDLTLDDLTVSMP